MKDIHSASSVSRIKSYFLLEGSAQPVVSFHERQLTVLSMPFLAVVYARV